MLLLWRRWVFVLVCYALYFSSSYIFSHKIRIDASYYVFLFMHLATILRVLLEAGGYQLLVIYAPCFFCLVNINLFVCLTEDTLIGFFIGVLYIVVVWANFELVITYHSLEVRIPIIIQVSFIHLFYLLVFVIIAIWVLIIV